MRYILVLIFLICLVTGCNDESYYAQEYHAVISNNDVGCSMETEGFRIIQEQDSNAPKIKGEVVVASFNVAQSDSLKMLKFADLCDTCIISAEVLCKYAKYPHRRSYYGCTGSHFVRIDSILSIK
jgi:hypothetical protein